MWKTVKLGDICLIQSGNSIAAKKKTELYTNVLGTPYVATKDVGFDGSIDYENGIYIPQEHVNSFKISPSGSTLVCAEGGSAGRKIAFSKHDCCYVNKLFSITPSEFLEPKYVYYYALSREFQTQFKAALHGLIGGVSLKKIKDFSITAPSLVEQQRIVAKLDAAFAEIDKTIILSEAAYSTARNLYQQELSNTFSETKEGWIDTTIRECCSLKSGNTLNKNLEQVVGEVPYLKVADMNLMDNINGITTSSRFVSKTAVSEKAFIKSGSVIFPKRGGAIATNKKRLTLVDICADLNIMSVQPNRSIQSELLYYYFQNIDMAKLGSGSSIPQINNYDIEPLRISYPCEAEEQRDLIKHLSSFESLSEKLGQTYLRKVDELSKLKAAILAQELQPPQSEAA